jgi:hypothetical protein
VIGALLESVLSELPEFPQRAAARTEELGLEAVAEEARGFWLSPLLSHYLPAQFPLSKAESVAARFRAARLERQTIEVLSLLEAAGLHPILLKGIDIAARLYPEPWLRPSVDVDVLVSPRELAAATQALVRAGWEQATAAPKTKFEFSKDLMFVAPRGGMLELHFGYDASFQARFDVDRLIARARVTQLGRSRVRALAEADDLVLQCTHAAHHVFDGVKWLFDLKLAAIATPSCWDGVPETAREYRVVSAVGMALREAVRRVKAPIPAHVLERLPVGLARQHAVRRLGGRLDPDAADLTMSLLLADRLSWGWIREAAVRPVGRVLQRAGLGDQAKQLAGRVAKRVGVVRREDT